MKRKFLHRRMEGEEMSLQITSMADVFIILLVFLLKSYAGGIVNIQPSQGTKLPQAFAANPAVEALKVEVTEKQIQIEGADSFSLNGFYFDPTDVLQNGASQKLSQLFEKERKKQILIAQNNADVKLDPKLLILADQKVPYSTIKTVLASAAVQGYTDFKLAVIQGD